MTFETKHRLTLLSTVVASLISTLSACGGGGSDDASTSATASSTTTAGETATNTATAEPLPEGPPAEDIEAANAIPDGFREPAMEDATSAAAAEATDATALADTAPTESSAAYYAPGGAGTTSSSSSSTSVVSSDIVYRLRASSIDSYKYAGVQCQGNNSYFWEWGGQSAYFKSLLPNPLFGVLDSATKFRAFSTVPSPGESSKTAFRWELHRSDPDTAGSHAKRCEFGLGWKTYKYPGKIFSQQIGLPKNKDFWWAVAVNAGDWRSTPSSDTQILWQWHDAYGNGLPPFLSLMTSGNRMWVQINYDMRTNPSNSTLRRVNPWRLDNWPANKWLRFVVQARKDTVSPNNGFVRIWMNGSMIVNYKGPFGYNVPQMDYAKVGLYHWISSQNTWDTKMPTRVLYTKGPVQVNHRAGYTWQSVNSLLE